MECITKETAVALMIAAENQNEPDKNVHPDVLEYVDDEYDVPEEITPETNETFDSVIEKYELDKNDYDAFDSTKQYEVDDILVYNNKIYKCIIRHLGEWKSEDFKECEYSEVIWGVGVIGKGTQTEVVNRLIYPDFSQISLINFNGVSGLG